MSVQSPAFFRVIGPQQPQRPVIVTVPHAGRYYPESLMDLARVGPATLRRLEDRYADLLAARLIDAGFTVLIADVARAYVDLNRAEDEWDEDSVALVAPTAPRSRPQLSRRARSGLGLIPSRLHPDGALWKRKLDETELARRLHDVHRPWHGNVDRLLRDARDQFGHAILLDLHSMPRQPGGKPQLVVGDRYGRSASFELTETLLALGQGQGLSATHNAPYAGAYTISQHGAPRAGIEAVQLEFDRSLYLTDDAMPCATGLGMCQELALILALAAEQRALEVGQRQLAAE